MIMSDRTLEGKHLVITGGAGALGRAVVGAALDRGARVTVLDRSQTALGDGVRCVRVDLADAAGIQAAWAGLEPVDVLCALAGGFAMGASAYAADGDEWNAMMQANVVSLRHVLMAAVPGMKARDAGRIITVGALSAQQGKASMSAYTASKAVVMNLTESLAQELADTGVRVNAILPSIIDTPSNRQAMPDANWHEWVAPKDMAEVICFLASHQSNAIHGALIPLRGFQRRA
jgi:NAD(P)-dependent dehydrogenase (short-subunit alcohol dehydrogenase family)